MDLDVSNFELTRGSRDGHGGVNASPAKEEYKKVLAAKLFGGSATNKVLSFNAKPPPPREDHQSSLRVLFTRNRDAGLLPKKYSRHIPQAPERILDAPEARSSSPPTTIRHRRKRASSAARAPRAGVAPADRPAPSAPGLSAPHHPTLPLAPFTRPPPCQLPFTRPPPCSCSTTTT